MFTLRLDYSRAQAYYGRIFLLLLVGSAGILLAGDAVAIDGNYSSPYASQWDSRNSVAKISDETLLGIILLLLNAVITTFYAVRHRIRRRRTAI